MKRPQPEFSRPLPVDRVPKSGSTEVIEAEPEECQALAGRMDLPAIHGLKATIRATPWRGGGMKLEGTLNADLDQVSVVSLEVFRHSLDIPILRYFLPPGAVPASGEDDADSIEHGIIDLGEVVAETLALELDPYPRKPGESFEGGSEEDDASAERESPFAVLAKARQK